MSLTTIKPYFKAKLDAKGYVEWTDGFPSDNIPSTLLDNAYHQRVISVDGVTNNHEVAEFSVLHEVSIFFKGYKDPAAAIDYVFLVIEPVITSCIDVSDYMNLGMKGVFFSSLSVEPLDEASNDNIIVARLQFNVRVLNCIKN